MRTVAPGSPEPVTIVPLPLIVASGRAGGVISGAVSGLGGEALPAASAWLTVSAWPLACAVVSVTV